MKLLTKKDLLKVLESVPDDAVLAYNTEEGPESFMGNISEHRVCHVTKNGQGKPSCFIVNHSSHEANKAQEKSSITVFMIE